MSNQLKQLEKVLKKARNKEHAKILQRFFKTSLGEYGEGDVFLGIKVPDQRKIAKQFYPYLSGKDIQVLLNSEIHEHRLVGLLILIKKYEQASDVHNEKLKQKIFDFYLENALRINNWDLVDLSAPNIVGDFLLDKNLEREILYKLANSKHLWERRIAIVSCFAFIRDNQFSDAIHIVKIFLKNNEQHDLVHKASGWMLREIGKRDVELLESFLKKFCKKMPRVMLRYSIEKFDKQKRDSYLYP